MRSTLRFARIAVVLALLPLALHDSVQSAGVPTDGRWEEMSQPHELDYAFLDAAGQRLIATKVKPPESRVYVWTLGVADSVWRPLHPLATTPVTAPFAMGFDPTRRELVIMTNVSTWVVPVSGAPSWNEVATLGTHPGAVFSRRLVYDSVRDRMLMFGGDSSGTLMNDTWELTLGATPTWSKLVTTGAPAARRAHFPAYESEGDRLVVFGGETASGRTNETWVLDLTTSSWSMLTPVTLPAARSNPAGAYDTLHDRLLIYDGRTDSGRLQDLWSLDLGPTPAWTQHALTSPPLASSYNSAVHDALTDRLIVVAANTVDVNDAFEPGSGTWVVDVDAGNSVRVAPAGTSPSARETGVGVYDPVGRQFLVFGGRFLSYYWPTDVWAMSVDTDRWSILPATGTPPPGLQLHTLIYDSIGHRMIAFGGRDSSLTTVNDAWAYDLTSGAWTLLAPTGTKPSPRQGPRAIFDPLANRMVVFGGQSLNDVWELTLGSSPAWSQILPSGGPPPGATGHVAIYDPVRHRLVTHLNDPNNETWALDLSAHSWANLTPAGPLPPARSGAAGIYDSSRDRLVVFGGYSQWKEVWAFDLGTNTWTELLPDGTLPEGRGNTAHAYDPIGDRMLIVNGNYNMPNGYSLWWSAPLAAVPSPPGPFVQLGPARPNPSSGAVVLDLTLPARSAIDVAVYDVTGRLVRRLEAGDMGPGRHTVQWNGLDASGVRVHKGVYFVSVTVDGVQSARRVVRLD